MRILDGVTRQLNRYGEEITVTTEKGSFKTKGILEPLLYKNKMYLGGKQIPDGYFDTGHYLLICPANITIPRLGTAFFQAGDSRYILKRSEIVRMNSENIYIWAVLSPYKKLVEEDFNEAAETA